MGTNITAEEFIREKIRQKLELKGEMMGLWCYSLNGEDALRWANEFAELKVRKQNASKDEGNCNKPAVSVAKRALCPTCGYDTLITLSGITYCMNDCCDGVKGHNER
jgi:hypothetical protein